MVQFNPTLPSWLTPPKPTIKALIYAADGTPKGMAEGTEEDLNSMAQGMGITWVPFPEEAAHMDIVGLAMSWTHLPSAATNYDPITDTYGELGPNVRDA